MENREGRVSIAGHTSVEAITFERHAMGAPVVRDTERFRLLFTNSRPKMPEGYSAPLEAITSRQLIDARLQAVAKA